jgi:alkylation response protein AidB-like acyl-CoA dehydrogenase
VGSEWREGTSVFIGKKWMVLTVCQLWTTNSGGWDSRGAALSCLVCRESKPDEPQDPECDPSAKILILLVTREDIDKNPSSAYRILSDPELPGHKSVNGPHTRFNNLRVPSSNLLAAPGAGAQVVEHTFGLSASLVGAMCVGVMRHAFELALAYCKQEKRGGKEAIITHQSVSDRLIDVKMKIEAARALTWKAMCALESQDESLGWDAKLELACEAKVWCSEQVVGVVEACMSVLGISAYQEEMGFTRILADAVCLPLFDGGNVGVRRRQIEKILQKDGYEPWATTFT